MLFGRDRICAVVAASTAAEMVRQFARALRYTHTIELRLDRLKGQQFDQFLSALPALSKRAVLIATCRHRKAGGRFSGAVGDQFARLVRASEDTQWCDIEMESAEPLPIVRMIRVAHRRSRFLISFHDFRRVPPNLDAIVRRLEHLGGDAVKIATQCKSIGDSLRLLALARGRRRRVVVPMGEAGLPGRVLALREGSALAYAAAGEATAAGQPTLDEMKRLYRADRLDRRTRVYGIIGNPIAHSLSPRIHNVGFQARRINAVYLPFLVRDLPDFLSAIEPLGIAGFSVTLPHKERILRYVDDCDPLADAIGAVNTVVVRGGGELYGYNTDYVGVLRALERRLALRGSRVLIYGAGGAARAVAFALAQGGAVVAVCARRPERARKLARAVAGELVERRRLRKEFFDAIINATPVGMRASDASPLLPGELNCRLVMDLIYRPARTKLLRFAERRGIKAIAGVEMFLAQGTAQWEIWTGMRAPEVAMRRALLAALRREQKSLGSP